MRTLMTYALPPSRITRPNGNPVRLPSMIGPTMASRTLSRTLQRTMAMFTVANGAMRNDAILASSTRVANPIAIIPKAKPTIPCTNAETRTMSASQRNAARSTGTLGHLHRAIRAATVSTTGGSTSSAST